jgi:transcription initiation factor IIF auxiliary subunit
MQISLTPTLSQGEREKQKKPLSLWERGWGEGNYSKNTGITLKLSTRFEKILLDFMHEFGFECCFLQKLKFQM